MSGLCPICQKDLAVGETVKLRDKGASSINDAARLRNDSIIVSSQQQVHVKCRKDYTNSKSLACIGTPIQKTKERQLRSEQTFKFSDHCIFCGKAAVLGKDVHRVSTFDCQQKILDICAERNDEWTEIVKFRIGNVHDLPAADALYHQQCSVNFRTKRGMPQNETPKGKGRPTNTESEAAFLKTMTHIIEHEDEQMSVSDLLKVMADYGSEDMCYSKVHMKKKIKEYFGDDVIISENEGKHDIVTLKRNAESILHDIYKDCKKDMDIDEKKKQILSAAAALIKSDIKSMSQNKDIYPPSYAMSSLDEGRSFVPKSLWDFLDAVFVEKEKDLRILFIAQCIIQATRPRSIIAPLQLGLAVQMHHHFASKFLNDTLHRLGFAVSYSEVHRYETAAAVTRGVSESGTSQSKSFKQFIADNVDHDVRTIDGKGTFHGMGIMSGSTPEIKKEHIIKRRHVSPEEYRDLAKINVLYYKARPLSKSLVFTKLKPVETEDLTRNMSLMSAIMWPKEKMGWSSMCQMIADGSFPGKSLFEFLPMIDLNPSDTSCIYSTMMFICKEAKKSGVDPVITFDQPLFWKAMTIIHSEDPNSSLKSIVLRLGGFHTEMSFLGTVGHIMSGLWTL